VVGGGVCAGLVDSGNTLFLEYDLGL
jgi:hypothetical protein